MKPARARRAPAPKNAGGRPTKYQPEYCEQVVQHCRRGASLTAFAASIGVSRTTIWNWCQDHPEFADACEIAQAYIGQWWELALRKVAAGGGGPGASQAAIFGVKNFSSFDFKDRREVEHTGHVDHRMLTYDQAVEEARRRGLPERVLLTDESEEEAE